MNGTIQTTKENLKIQPTQILDSTDQALAIGDLHGNAMKGIYFLIRYGVMKLENPQDYDSLWSIYNTKTDALTSEQLTQFQTILTNASVTSPKLITFIGDELSDRGNNDWFTLLLMKTLHEKNVPYQIQLSNHSSVALQSFSTNRPLPGMIGSAQNNQQRSLDNMWALVKKGLITKEEVGSLANEFYKPHLRMIGYTKTTNDHITLYTHAPVGLETVRDLSAKFEIKYDDSTIESLIFCINEINKKASESMIKNDFKQYHDVTNRDNTNDPLDRLFWSRELQPNFTLTPTYRSFKVECVHGHIGPGKILNDGLRNTDSHWGMFPTDDVGDCTIFCETAGHEFSCSFDENENIVKRLIAASEKYLDHLDHLDGIEQNDLATKKIDIITKGLDALKTTGSSAHEKLIGFNSIILKNQDNILCLGTRRDNAAETFFKAITVAIVSIASFGFLANDVYQRFFGEKSTEGKKFISDITKYKQALTSMKDENRPGSEHSHSTK